MKVLIVDDEKHVREAIRYFVPWEQYGVSEILEATNGQEAVRIMLEQQPAVVFTDMRMPLMDGAGLLEWIHRRSPYTKTIVISGYQDFSYVKQAIVYGGMDYLLKPVNRKQLVAAAERAFQKWNEEKQERERSFHQNIQLNVLRPLYWDKTLTDLVGDAVSYPELEEALSAELGLPKGSSRCRTAVISLESSGARLLQKFRGDVQLTSFVLANVCNEMVSPRKEGYAFRYWQEGADVVILFWDRLDEAEARLEEINRSISAVYGQSLEIGLSPEYPFPEGLSDAFRFARAALADRNLLQAGRHIHTSPPQAGEEGQGAGIRSGERLEKLRLSLLSGDTDRMVRSFEEWADTETGSGILTLSRLREMEAKLADTLAKWKMEWSEAGGEADRLPPLPDAANRSGEFSLEQWKERLKALILNLAAESRLSRTSDSRIVLEIREYLDRNYSGDITLQHIADRFFLSRENVSRKFKQVTGENLSDYLTNLRVEKAKELLQNSDMRMSRISELVGYDDEKYFSRVFKKATGLTPREFRKREEDE